VTSKVDKELTFSVAIASDLHCQLRHSGSIQESFLLVGAPRSPAGCHPVQSLIEYMQEKKIKADCLLCLGDVANRASKEGLTTGISYLFELEKELKCKNVICTVGNHDVDSRKTESTDPFSLSQSAHPRFPMNPRKNTQYWGNGSAVIKISNKALFAVLNTVADHVDEPTAKRGSFLPHRIDRLDTDLNRYKKSELIRIAVLHHHPVLHSSTGYTTTDVLENGDQVLDLLSKHRFDVVIHGHKHQPLIRRYDSSGRIMIVIAAGSFSAILQKIGSSTRNLFHILSITKKKGKDDFAANLKSWEYNYGRGWHPTSRKSSGLPRDIQFRRNISAVELDKVITFIRSQPLAKITGKKLFARFPGLAFLLPDEIERVGKDLEENYNIKFVYDEYGFLYEAGKI
jgi:predicted phosphodiesterase